MNHTLRHISTDLAAMSDGRLLSAFDRTGDDDAFDELLRRYYDRARAVARRRVGDADCHDVVQVAFISVARNSARFTADSEFVPWFFVILRNACFDHLRKCARSQRKLTEFQDSQSFPRQSSENGVLELTEGLAPMDRAVIIDRYRNGLSFKELSEKLGCSVEAAKKRAQRALEKLRTMTSLL